MLRPINYIPLRKNQYSNERDIKNAFTCTLGSRTAAFTLLFDFIKVKLSLLPILYTAF